MKPSSKEKELTAQVIDLQTQLEESEVRFLKLRRMKEENERFREAIGRIIKEKVYTDRILSFVVISEESFRNVEDLLRD